MAGLRAEIIESLGGLRDFESATLDLADGVAELRGKTAEYESAVADGTLTGEDAAAALRDLRQAQISSGEGALIAAQAFADQAGAADGSKRQASLMKQELQRLQEQYPELRGEIQGYIDKLDTIPKSKETTVTTPGAVGSKAQVDDLRDSINNLHDKTVNITTWFHTRGPGGNDLGGGSPVPGGSTEAMLGGGDPFTGASRRVKNLIDEAQALKKLADATDDAEKKDDLLAKAKAKAEQASKLHSAALEREADRLRRTADAAVNAAERREDRANERADSAFDAADAQIRAADARRNAHEANRAAMQRGAGIPELDRAKDAAMRVAEADLELAREQAEAQGKTLSASQETAILLKSLQRQADRGNAAVGKVLQQLIDSMNLDDRIRQQRVAERQAERAEARAERLEERARELERRANQIERRPVNLVINAPLVSGPQLGSQVVKAIKEFERVNGSGWRR
jgi:hypothetical protein